MSTESFMIEFIETTEQNPFANHERVWNRSAAFELHPFAGNIHLDCIRSFFRSAGDGSKALDWLCELADHHNVSIEGTAQPTGQTKPRFSLKQLCAWYKRHGFTVNKLGHIKRTPKLKVKQP